MEQVTTMNFEDKEDFHRREAELKKREMDLRLRELELELDRQEPPLYETKKHSEERQMAGIANKLVKYGRFVGFIIMGIALVKAGFIVGFWLSNAILLAIIGFISYNIFLKNKD